MAKAVMTVLCLWWTVSAGAAFDLERALAENVIEQYALDTEYVAISLVRSDLRIDEVDGAELKVYPMTTSAPRGRFPVRVEVFRDGAMVDRGSASLDVRISADIIVPAVDIGRHELLTPDMFTVKRLDITSLRETVVTDLGQLEGCRAKRNLKAGDCLTASRVERIPDVENGLPVTIVGAGAGFEIRARGVALQNGYIGETIKVKNTDSRKILVGTITAPGVVEVTI